MKKNRVQKNNISRNNQKAFTLIELIVVMAVFLFVIGAAIGIFLSVIKSQKQVLSEQQLLNQISYVTEYMSKGLRMAKIEETTEDCLVDYSPGANPSNYHYGYIYLLTRYDSLLGRYNGIKFLSQSNYDSAGRPSCQEFYLDTTTTPYVLKEIRTYSPYTRVSDEQAVALTPSDLKINSIRFTVNGGATCADQNQCGASDQDSSQPRVTIFLSVGIPGDSLVTGTNCNNDTDCHAGGACNLSIHRCVPTRTIQTTVSQRNLNINNGQR